MQLLIYVCSLFRSLTIDKREFRKADMGIFIEDAKKARKEVIVEKNATSDLLSKIIVENGSVI